MLASSASFNNSRIKALSSVLAIGCELAQAVVVDASDLMGKLDSASEAHYILSFQLGLQPEWDTLLEKPWYSVFLRP